MGRRTLGDKLALTPAACVTAYGSPIIQTWHQYPLKQTPVLGSGARGGGQGWWPSTGISSGQWCAGWWPLAFYRDSGARGGGLWPSTGTVV